MSGRRQLSYSHGTSTSAAARRDNRRQPPPGRGRPSESRGAGRRGDRPPMDLRAARRGQRHAGPRPDRRRHRRPATGSASGLRTAPSGCCCSTRPRRIGAILVNINPAYRSHELGYVLRQSGIRLLVSAETFKTSDYRGMIDEVSGDLPDLERVIYLGTADWERLFADGSGPRRRRRRTRRPAASGRRACPSTTRSTSSTRAARPASPKARRSRTTTS